MRFPHKTCVGSLPFAPTASLPLPQVFLRDPLPLLLSPPSSHLLRSLLHLLAVEPPPLPGRQQGRTQQQQREGEGQWGGEGEGEGEEGGFSRAAVSARLAAERRRRLQQMHRTLQQQQQQQPWPAGGAGAQGSASSGRATGAPFLPPQMRSLAASLPPARANERGEGRRGESGSGSERGRVQARGGAAGGSSSGRGPPPEALWPCAVRGKPGCLSSLQRQLARLSSSLVDAVARAAALQAAEHGDKWSLCCDASAGTVMQVRQAGRRA